MRITPFLNVTLIVGASAMLAIGCGGSGNGGSGGGNGGGDDVKIGLVTDVGGLNDRSFNTLANEGLKRAEDELDVEGTVLESNASSDYEPNLGKLVTQNYDLVIGVGFLMGDSIKATAEKSKKTNFAIIDFSYGEQAIPNVRGVLFKEQEAGYLAGVLAGAVEEDGTLEGLNEQKVVSAVGGQKIPPVDKFIAGFQKGVKDTCKDCKVLVAYSQDFVAQDKCKEQALTQIQRGSDIVFQVAGGCGLGALDAAKQKGVWGIGVDADQAYLGDHILTSAIKRVDVAVFDVIESVTKGEFKGGEDGIYGLEEGGVGLGKIAAPAEKYQDQVDEATEKVKAGEVEIPEEVAAS